ncbi:MAG: RHS repeat-associated core domain-containing protein, partial [Nitrospirota bacterium]
NGITRRYVYDGEDILLEYDGANVLQARYTHGRGIDEPIAVTKGGNTFFYHQDGLGTVTDLTNSTGATAKSYSYDAYGNLVDQTGTVEQPYTYTGREFDSESGLYYYRNRHLDTTTGRFLQKDPQFTFRGGDLNIYRYAKSNPILRRDPFGLFSVSGCCGNEDTVRNEVRGSCGKVTNNISNPPLMACVLKRCADATLECEKDCDPPTLGYNRSFLGIRSSTIHVCTNTAPPWKYGEIAIHEWAHSCGWDHGEGSGVPGDSGVTDIQDRDPVWAPDAK